jgi:glycosyltransferase involved in cell wall biosynthesis
MSTGHVARLVVLVLGSLGVLRWLWQAVAVVRGMPTLPDLLRPAPSGSNPTRAAEALPEPAANTAPDLTVIVPACNEEASIQATLRSLLKSTGVRLQIVAVNDRSTDTTGALMDEIAAQAQAGGPHTLEVIHNSELPAGWLGKTHALALGTARATAPWLLFTDGDVTFDPRAVALTLEYARRERADHVVLLLTLVLTGIGDAAVFAALQALGGFQNRLWKVADPMARDFFGAGGFNLVKREVYERVGGFEALRMEVVEDLRLAWKIKRAGYAQRIVLGPGLARIRWISGALGIVGLIEKNGFAAMRYKVGVSLLMFFSFAMAIVLPFAAIAVAGWGIGIGLAIYALMAVAYAANRRVTQVSPWLVLLFAPAASILLYALARSMVLTLWRGGVEWRGTRYPLDELRRNAGPWWW